MEIKQQYLARYLHQIAADQLVEEYTEKGYEVRTNERIGKYEADLVARKGEEILVIEIKTGKLTPERRRAIEGMAEYLQERGRYKWLVVAATPPKKKKLVVNDIEEMLTQYFIEHFPDELDQLSTHSRIEYVSDVDVDELELHKDFIRVVGDGVFNIELQFGSDNDQKSDLGYKSGDSVPFDFDITMEYNDRKELEIHDVNRLKIDTSFFYGSNE